MVGDGLSDGLVKLGGNFVTHAPEHPQLRARDIGRCALSAAKGIKGSAVPCNTKMGAVIVFSRTRRSPLAGHAADAADTGSPSG